MPCSKCHPQPLLGTPKVLYFDTENSPNYGAFYGKPWKTRILWYEKDWQFLIFTYAWDDGPIQAIQSWNEKSMVKMMWGLIDEADILVAHNAAFDMGHFYTKCLQYGLGVPRQPKIICTLKRFRKLCPGGFRSNSLDDVAEALGVGKKKELSRGFWQKYMLRIPKYVRQGVIYAKHDIYLLRGVHKAIDPFFPPTKIKQLKTTTGIKHHGTPQ